MKTRGKIIISITLILGLILGGGALWIKNSIIDEPLATQVDPSTGKTIQAFNVLLLGSDARAHEKKGRTDAIIVVQVSKDKISMLSIPRDTRVEIPGHGLQKINAAAFFEKPEVTAQLVSEIIGQPVDKYVLVRWEGFMNIVDAIGGVDVEIPKNITSYSLDGYKHRVDLEKGTQHLDGNAALAFVRYRKEALGDIYRVNSQLTFMKAFAEKCKQPSILLKLPSILPELFKNVDTNMKFKELAILAKAGMDFKDSTVLTQALPGYFFHVNGASYWGFDSAQAKQVTYNLFFNGETTSEVVLETPPGMDSEPPKSTQVAQQPEEEKDNTPQKPQQPTEPKKDPPKDEPDEGETADTDDTDDANDTNPEENKGDKENTGGKKDSKPSKELDITVEHS